MRDSINHKFRRGYLLFEVVLALILAGLLLGGVMSIATGALQVSEIIAQDGRQQLTREAFLTFVGRNLEQLPGNAVLDLQREDAGSHYTSKLTFQNVPTSFSWSGQAISAEAIQLSAELRRDGDLDLVLKYFEEPILDDSDSTAQVNADPVAEITLLRDVWRFEWWALDGRTMEWTETWDVRGRLPLQLELNVIFDRNGEEIIHYFWIPPKVNPETIMRSLQPGRGTGRGAQPQPGGETPGGPARWRSPGRGSSGRKSGRRGNEPRRRNPSPAINSGRGAATMRSSPQFKRGSTLIAVFWMMSILGLAVFASIRLLYYEVDLVTAQVHGTKARQLAEMGVAIAANPVVERTDPLLHLEFEGGLSGVDVQMASEGARFNINLLLAKRGDVQPDKPLVREIFAEWGLDLDVSDEIVDALVDWVDEDEFEELNGAEFTEYEDMGYQNRPYNRPFYSLDEMRLVRGMDIVEAANPNWREWFTIWSGGGLDVNEASPELLARAAEVSIADAQSITDRVVGIDGIRGNEDDLPFNNSTEVMDLLGIPEIQRILVEPRLTANDPTTRIEATGWSGDIRRRIILVVRNRTGRPSILERREEMVP